MNHSLYFLLANTVLITSFFHSIKLLSYSIVAFLLLSIIFFFDKRVQTSFHSLNLKKTACLLLPVIVLLLSMIWTENQKVGWDQILRVAPLISLPFCGWVQGHIVDKTFSSKLISIWLILSTMFSIYGFSIVFFAYEIDYFTSLTFIHIRHLLQNEILNMHPVYIGLVCGVSSVISFNKVIKKREPYKLLYAIALLINIITLLLVSARMPILATFFCCLIQIKFNKKTLFFCVLAGLLFFFLTPKVFPGYRFNEIPQLFSNRAEDKTTNTLSTRQNIYSCSIKLIGDKPLIGYGIGDSVDAIQNCQVMQSEEGRLNSHNQYLEYLLATGIFGFSLFIVYLLSLFKSLRSRDSTFGVVLLAYFILNMITENILARTWGVFLFSYPLFIFYFYAPLISAPKTRQRFASRVL